MILIFIISHLQHQFNIQQKLIKQNLIIIIQNFSKLQCLNIYNQSVIKQEHHTILKLQHQDKMKENIIVRPPQRPKTSKPQRYVNIKIKNNLNRDEDKINKILDQAKPYLKNKQWRFIQEKQLKKSGILNLLDILDVILIESLVFHFCKCSTVSKTLTDISFPRLRSLCLPGNKIKTIESLQRTNLPCLQFLQLRQNEIVHIKSLTKLNCDSLESLEISQSKIVQINYIWQKAKFVQHLTDVRSFNSKHLQFDTQIIKIDFNKINNFWIRSSHQMFVKQCVYFKAIIIKKHQNKFSLWQGIKFQTW